MGSMPSFILLPRCAGGAGSGGRGNEVIIGARLPYECPRGAFFQRLPFNSLPYGNVDKHGPIGIGGALCRAYGEAGVPAAQFRCVPCDVDIFTPKCWRI